MPARVADLSSTDFSLWGFGHARTMEPHRLKSVLLFRLVELDRYVFQGMIDPVLRGGRAIAPRDPRDSNHSQQHTEKNQIAQGLRGLCLPLSEEGRASYGYLARNDAKGTPKKGPAGPRNNLSRPCNEESSRLQVSMCGGRGPVAYCGLTKNIVEASPLVMSTI